MIISGKRMLKLLLSLVIISLFVIVSVSVYFLVQRNKAVELPKPTGELAVGRTEYEWIDNARNEIFSGEQGNKRRLSVWIWYPSDLKTNATRTDYFPGMWEAVEEKDSGITMYLQQSFKTVRTNSYKDVPLSTRETTYPIVIFEPGMGNAVFNYTTLVENLASHGYIVVGVNPTYSCRYVVFSDGSIAYRTPQGSMPEGDPSDEQLNDAGSRLIKTWSDDIIFVAGKLNELNKEHGGIWNGHMDLKRIGAFGHSFGGAASVNALLDDRIKAAVDIDGYLFGVERNPDEPLMFIMCRHQQNEIDLAENTKIREVCRGLGNDGHLVEMPNAAHYSFLDNAVFFSPVARAMGVFGSIDGKSGLETANSQIAAFFDAYLKNIRQ